MARISSSPAPAQPQRSAAGTPAGRLPSASPERAGGVVCVVCEVCSPPAGNCVNSTSGACVCVCVCVWGWGWGWGWGWKEAAPGPVARPPPAPALRARPRRRAAIAAAARSSLPAPDVQPVRGSRRRTATPRYLCWSDASSVCAVEMAPCAACGVIACWEANYCAR